MRRIAVLDLTTPFAASDPAHTSGRLLRAWLQPSLPDDSIEIHDIAAGGALPDLSDCDGVVIGGSEKGVYDDTPWMRPLRGFLRAARDAGRPMVGVCFGHQIMADTFGGRAAKAGHGMRVGACAFDIDGSPQMAHVWHQDQVVEVPPGARVAGQAEYCPMAVLDYDFGAFSVQFHPEFTAPYMLAEIGHAIGVSLTATEANAAMDSVRSAHVPADLMADRAAQTLRGRA